MSLPICTENLQRVLNSKWDEGVAVEDLLGPLVSNDDIVLAVGRLTVNYGVSYATQEHKVKLLRERMREYNWTSLHFHRAINHIIDTCTFADWNIARVLEAPVIKLYTDSWKNQELKKKDVTLSMLECYEIMTVKLWRYQDGTTLPFKLVYRGGQLVERKSEEVTVTDEDKKAGREIAAKIREELRVSIREDNEKGGDLPLSEVVDRMMRETV